MPSPTDPRRARSRGKLLDAAVALLASGGAAAVTVEAVTRASGVARTTLYRNFPSTDALIAAAFRRLLPTPEGPVGGTVREQLVSLSTEMARTIQDAPLQQSMLGWLAMGRHTDDQDEVGALRRGIVSSYTEPLHHVLSAAERDGILVPGELDRAVAQLAGPVVLAKMIGLRPYTDGDIADLVDDFLRGRFAP